MRRTLDGMPRLALPAVALTLALSGPALAAGHSDPLLSGYGGPGDGEQTLLGQTLILGDSGSAGPGGGGVAGATAAPAPKPDALYEAAPEPAAETPAGGTGTGAAGTPAARRPGSGGRPSRGRERPEVRRPDPRPSAAPETVGTPARAVSAPAPVDGRDGLLLAAIALLIVALAGSARRLAVGAARSRRATTLQPR